MNNENTATATATAVEVGAAKEVNEPAPVVSFKEIAMPLVARGIPVIPIPPRQKGAVLKNWPELATTDLVQIEKWNKENAQFNVGAVAKLDGFWMLDCDVPGLPQQIENEIGKPFPNTFTVKSSRGYHYYFCQTDASRQMGNVSVKGFFDAQVNNKYVVAPGSAHPDGPRYKVVNDGEIVPAPDCLVEWIQGQYNHAEADEQQHGTNEGKVHEGGRDNFLFHRACKLRKAGLSKAAALAALLNINQEQCAPPMEESIVHQKIESAYSYEFAQEELFLGPDGLSLTDFGNAERFVQTEGKGIRYCGKSKSWYVWNERTWQKDESGEIYRRGKKTIKAMLHEAAELDNEQGEILEAYEKKCESEGRLNAMVNLSRWEAGVPIQLEHFDTNPMLFNCANVTIDLAAGQPREHCREDFISKISPVEYAPDVQCPNWLNFLETVTDHDEELRAYLQRCVGYSLTGQTTEHAVFLLYGTGANGKSTFFEALRYVFGDYAQAAEFSTFLATNAQNVRNDLAKLNGARFVTAVESDSGKRLDETLVKQMTAGDTVTARYLYSEHFEYKPQFKLWLGTNHKPTIRGQDEGVWRRIRLIPFTVFIPLDQQDRNLSDKLKMEASGILNWALKGLAEWRANGLQDPSIVKEATKEYRMNEDVIGLFLETKCVLEGQCTASALYKAYRDWAEHSGEFQMSQRRFSNALSERGFQKVRHSAGNEWKGIGLASDSPW